MRNYTVPTNGVGGICEVSGQDARDTAKSCPELDGKARHIATLKAYLLMKVEQGDWHGVSDAANDIRVLEGK